MIDDDKYEAEIIDVMLSSEDNDECLIHDKDMEQYLKYATAQRVTMDTMAEEMLNKYFKATRAARKSKRIRLINHQNILCTSLQFRSQMPYRPKLSKC